MPINPSAWTPPPAPALTGQYEQNSRLADVRRLSIGDGHAPEDVAIDAEGRIYAGFEDGNIIQLQPHGSFGVFANIGGRPLGLIFDRDGNLLVTDALKGLLSINKNGEVKLLADKADDGAMFGCLNDIDVAADGTIYFSEASRKFRMAVHVHDLLEHQPNGRLLAFDPATQKVRTVLRDLYFANGVAVSPDQSFVLVAETGKYRVQRLWLTGPKAGTSEVFIDNLPGFPDGISAAKTGGADGKFWLAIVTPRQALFDRLLPHPFLRKVVYRLPKFLQPAPERYSFVLGLDAQGRITDNLQNGAPECYAQIANVIEHNGFLYFGSIGEDALGRFTLR